MSQRPRRGDGVVKEEVKAFQATLDKSTVAATVFFQPSFYMALASGLFMIVTQRFPEELMTPKMLTMSYNGIKASALLSFPFCLISGIYFAVASAITTSPVPLKGHFLGYSVSLSLGLFFLTLRRVSWYYPLLGVFYLSYGSLHHYRRMMVYGDNAPVFNWNDFGEIYRDWKLQRRLKREATANGQQRSVRQSIR